jgi:hypothetical protein
MGIASSQLIEEVEHYLNSPAPKTSEIVLEVRPPRGGCQQPNVAPHQLTRVPHQEIGMQECMQGLVDRVLGPLVARLYPDVAAGLTYHHSFIVRLAPTRSLLAALKLGHSCSYRSGTRGGRATTSSSGGTHVAAQSR